MATRSRLAVILHADVVGSTTLVQQDERIAHELRGDALVAEFERASDAVSAALRFQAENETANNGFTDHIRPEIRIGIALGEVVIADRTVTGAGVVLAQRLEQLARPGGLCISAAINEALPARLPFLYSPLDEQKVKGFDEPIRAFLVVVRDDGAVPAPEAKDSRGARIGLRWIAATAVLVVAALGLGAWFLPGAFQSGDGDAPPSLGTPELSIAVLPFDDLSGDEGEIYFADALTEDLTSDLSRISGSFVISRRTAATYRGQDVDARQVSNELNVRYLLEGSVRRADSRVRVSVQLIDGETARQLWSERYERSEEDMHAFQQEVTGRVARTLNLELKDALSREAARSKPGNLDANDLTQRAWAELWTKPQNSTTNDAALSYASRALEIDPENAEAMGVAAYAYARAANYGWGMSRAEGLDRGIAIGERSISLEPDNADAVYSLGFLYHIAGETLKSQELMRQCIAINRNHAPAYFFYGLNLIRLGRPQDALQWVERAFVLSPRDPLRAVWHAVIARIHLLAGDDAIAVQAAQKGIAANHKLPHNYAVLASAYAHQGQLEKARTALEEFQRLQPFRTASEYQRNLTADDPVAIKTYERLISGLRKAGMPG